MTDRPIEAEVLGILQSRASTYRFLSQMYRQEVATSFLAELVKQLTAEEEGPAGSEGHRVLREYAAEIEGADLEKVRTDLASEYAALFLNVGRRAVYPSESVYTSPERLIMQKARNEVLAEYRKEGLDRIGEFREPEDHIAIELDFMAYLCQKSADAVEAGDEAAALEYLNKQEGFLKKHLLVWTPQFCGDVQRATRTGFYEGIARITEEHLAHEEETIAELVTVLQSAMGG